MTPVTWPNALVLDPSCEVTMSRARSTAFGSA
jgi:hypothetical protein